MKATWRILLFTGILALTLFACKQGALDATPADPTGKKFSENEVSNTYATGEAGGTFATGMPGNTPASDAFGPVGSGSGGGGGGGGGGGEEPSTITFMGSSNEPDVNCEDDGEEFVMTGTFGSPAVVVRLFFSSQPSSGVVQIVEPDENAGLSDGEAWLVVSTEEELYFAESGTVQVNVSEGGVSATFNNITLFGLFSDPEVISGTLTCQ